MKLPSYKKPIPHDGLSSIGNAKRRFELASNAGVSLTMVVDTRPEVRSAFAKVRLRAVDPANDIARQVVIEQLQNAFKVNSYLQSGLLETSLPLYLEERA